MIKIFPYPVFYAGLCPPYSHNVRQLAAVAATEHFSTSNRRESSIIIQTTVVPPSWQTAR